MKRLGFTVGQIKRMPWKQAQFWLESIAYDAELSAPAAKEEKEEVHDLSELVGILPKAEEKKDGVEHQG